MEKVVIAKDGNFKTLESFMEKLPEISGEIEVSLPEEIYFLENSLVFDIKNSKDKKITFVGGEHTVISGGVKVEDWKKQENGNLWYAASPLDNFRQLYVNGKRAERARSYTKHVGMDHVEGDYSFRDGIKISPSIECNFKNISDVEIVWEKARWRHFRHRIEKVTENKDENGKIISRNVFMQQPYYAWGTEMSADDFTIYKPVPANPFYFENAFELLTEPGQWYLDRSEGVIYYLPYEGEELTEVIVPSVERMIVIEGEALDKKVENISFENISFMHAGWMRPTNKGFASFQAQLLGCMPHRGSDRKFEIIDGAIVVTFAKNINFTGCTFAHMGADAVRMIEAVEDSSVKDSSFYDISNSALQIGTPEQQGGCNNRVIGRNTPENVCKNINIARNIITGIGAEFTSAPAITVFCWQNSVISHNEISEIPYSGISMGWGWDAPVDKIININNTIEGNIIHDFLKVTEDGGAIYTLGRMENTVIRNNYLYNQHNDHAGVYADNGSINVEVYNNVFEDIKNFFFVWSKDISKIKGFGNYTDSLCMVNGGTQCKSYDNYVFEKGYPCKEAQEIIAQAGRGKAAAADGGMAKKFTSYHRINCSGELPWYNTEYETNAVIVDLGKIMKFDKVFYDIFPFGYTNYIRIFTSENGKDFIETAYQKCIENCGHIVFENQVTARYICAGIEIHEKTEMGAMPIKSIIVR